MYKKWEKMTIEEIVNNLEDIIETFKNDEEYEDWVMACKYARNMAIESLSADIQKYETFYGVPMEEAYKVMRGYSLGEYAEMVYCKYCQHHGRSDCPMCEGAITEDYMWCSHWEKKK